MGTVPEVGSVGFDVLAVYTIEFSSLVVTNYQLASSNDFGDLSDIIIYCIDR